MKTTLETRTQITELIRTYLSARFPAVLEAIKADPAKVSSAELWTIWHHITDEIRFDDSHGRFANRKRVFPHNFDFPLYPDGTNDDTCETALRWAIKQL
jgi:hypothetical protein